MKKILSLIMAVLMAFSVFTVAVSAEEATEPAPACTHKLEDGKWAGKWVISIEATCTEKGVKYLECTLCGKIETGFVNAEGHTFGEEVTVEATCATEGSTSKTCTKCGLVEKTNVIPAKPHTYGEFKEVLAAGCEAAGSKERTCAVCNHVDKVEIAALGHNYHATVIAPDYDKEGYTLHKCTRCEKQYTDTFVDKLKGKLDSIELGGTISINAEDTYSIDVDKCVVIKGDAKIVKTTFKSSDEKVVTVDDKGVLTGKGLGTAKVTVTVTDEYGNTKEDTVEVRVNFSILDWFKFIGTLIISAITIVLGGLDFSSLGQLFEGLIPKE